MSRRLTALAAPKSVPSTRPQQRHSPRIAQKRAQMRDALLAVGARLFVAKGWQNVSVEDVIGAAEMARSTFYTFFSSRRDLLRHILMPVFETGLASFQALKGRPPRQIMLGIIDTYLTLWERHGDALLLSIRIGKDEFSLFQAVHNRYVEALKELLAQVQPTGLLRNNSAAYTGRLIARTAVEILIVYKDDPDRRRLYSTTMEGLLLAPGP
jgi:AcrR family transcriptional regulator